MIKITCDKCGKEVSVEFSYCEIKTRDRRDAILRGVDKKPIVQPQIKEEVFHLCTVCRNELFSSFKKLK